MRLQGRKCYVISYLRCKKWCRLKTCGYVFLKGNFYLEYSMCGVCLSLSVCTCILSQKEEWNVVNSYANKKQVNEKHYFVYDNIFSFFSITSFSLRFTYQNWTILLKISGNLKVLLSFKASFGVLFLAFFLI